MTVSGISDLTSEFSNVAREAGELRQTTSADSRRTGDELHLTTSRKCWSSAVMSEQAQDSYCSVM